MVVVIQYGADSHDLTTLVGKTLSVAEAVGRQMLTIPAGAEVRLNNTEASGTAVLKDGDVVSFYKASGEKGC